MKKETACLINHIHIYIYICCKNIKVLIYYLINHFTTSYLFIICTFIFIAIYYGPCGCHKHALFIP